MPIRRFPLLPLALLLGAAATAAPARADSTEATCVLSRHVATTPMGSTPPEKGPCTFSQRQGNVSIRFGARVFEFPSADEGRTYRRSASSEGIRFTRQGEYSLQVLWSGSQSAIPRP